MIRFSFSLVFSLVLGSLFSIVGCDQSNIKQDASDLRRDDAFILADAEVEDVGVEDFGIVDATLFVTPDEGDTHDAELLVRCTRDDDCLDETQVCFVGHCLEPCLEVPRGYNIIATVSQQTDPFGMPVGSEYGYGTRMCLTRSSAVVMNVLTPEGVYLASAVGVDELGRNCGHEGAANMRPLNRRIFQNGYVPEDWGMQLECLGRAPGGTYMSWVKKILPSNQ